MNLKYYMDTVSFWNTASIPSEFARNLPFYIQQCAYFRAGKDYFTERSGVDSYLLMYTIAGEGVLQYREQEFYLKPGYAVLIDCRKYQFYSTGKSGKWELCHPSKNGRRKASKNGMNRSLSFVFEIRPHLFHGSLAGDLCRHDIPAKGRNSPEGDSPQHKSIISAPHCQATFAA